MKLNLVPARTGLTWVRLGLRVFRRQPMALTALFFLCLACMSLASRLPVVGEILTLMLLPTATLIMMVAAAEVHQGRMPAPAMVAQALRAGKAHLRDMTMLGLLYAGGFLLVIGLSSLIDGGQFAHVYLGGGEITREIAESASFQAAVWVAVLLYLPLSLLFWHAPGLVHWHGVAPVKALFFSAVACVRNFRAFVVYGLGWMGTFLGTGVIVSLVVTMLSAAGVGMGVVTAIMLVTAVVLAAMLFSSVVFSFRDCFEPPQQRPGPALAPG